MADLLFSIEGLFMALREARLKYLDTLFDGEIPILGGPTSKWTLKLVLREGDGTADSRRVLGSKPSCRLRKEGLRPPRPVTPLVFATEPCFFLLKNH